MAPRHSTIPTRTPPKIAPTKFPRPPITAAINAFNDTCAPSSAEMVYIGPISIPDTQPSPAEMAKVAARVASTLTPIAAAVSGLSWAMRIANPNLVLTKNSCRITRIMIMIRKITKLFKEILVPAISKEASVNLKSSPCGNAPNSSSATFLTTVDSDIETSIKVMGDVFLNRIKRIFSVNMPYSMVMKRVSRKAAQYGMLK